jgi:parvulin-like peptidyl-prolyl isomerase
MKNSLKLLTTLLICTLLFAACGKKSDDQSENAADNSSKSVFVIINGERISTEDYQLFISYSVSMMDTDTKTNPEVIETLKKDFIEHRMLMQKALENDINIDEDQFAEIVESFQTIKGQKTLSEFEKQLNMDFQSLKELLCQRIIIGKFLETIADRDITISEEDLKAYYNEKKNEINEDVSAHVLHIVTYDEQAAQNALALIKQGIPFSEAAEKFSVAPERENGGDLGYINVSEYPDIFREVLTLKNDQVSGIIKSEYGFHIFKLLDVQKKANVGFEALKKKLYAELYGIKQEYKVREYIDGLYQNSEIIYPDNNSVSGS